MSKPNILIVDDTPANILTLKKTLQSLDVNILAANSGNEALSVLTREPVALILLDVQMPDLNGFEVAELLMEHEDTKLIPIIFLTAFDKEDKFLFRGYEVGGVDYIFKPFNPEIIKSKVSVFIKLYNQKAELAKQKGELSVLLEENLEQKRQLNKYFKNKLWLTAVGFGSLIILALIFNGYIYFQNSKLNHLIKYTNELNNAYKRFIPYDILTLLNKKSIVDVNLGDQVLKDMNVMFVDVRGYSSIAENLTPEENITLTNAILQMMQKPILTHKGIVNKYLGDGLMALFHTEADDAIDASIALLKQFAEFSQKRVSEEKSPIRVGIGIDAGEMIVGTVGSEDRMEHTVVADAVNVASRIEGITKLYGSTLIISENVYKRLKNPKKYTIRFLDTVRVKGRKKPVVVYQVLDGECASTIELYKNNDKDFSEGILLFRERKFSEAKHSFKKVLDLNQDDQAAKIYFDRCTKYLTQPVDEEWSYIQNLEFK